jgi:hypothetical protein
MLRRIRGVLGTALTWGIVWSLAGLACGGVELYRTRPRAHGMSAAASVHFMMGPAAIIAAIMLPPLVGFFAVTGGAAGAIFALSLSHVKRVGSVEALSIRRVAVWGAIGGMAVPLMRIVSHLPSHGSPSLSVFIRGTLSFLGIASLLGAASAAGSLALARRAPREVAQLSPRAPDIATSRNDVVDASAVCL